MNNVDKYQVIGHSLIMNTTNNQTAAQIELTIAKLDAIKDAKLAMMKCVCGGHACSVRAVRGLVPFCQMASPVVVIDPKACICHRHGILGNAPNGRCYRVDCPAKK